MKMVVYRWRTSAKLLKALRTQARQEQISLRTLLERIVFEYMQKRRSMCGPNSSRLDHLPRSSGEITTYKKRH